MSEQTKDGGQDLHARIMNLPCKDSPVATTTEEVFAYRIGHRDARHAAAELAAEHGHALHLARSRILELEEALRSIVAFCDDPRGSETGESLACGLSRLLPAARSVLNKENDRA